MKTKKELEQSIVMLEDALQSSTSSVATYQEDLETAKKQLADVNKPVLTPEHLDQVQEAIEKAVGEFDFSDHDNYDKEFELDYDGRVQLSNFDFINSHELVEMIVEKVHALFVEADMIGSEIDTERNSHD